MKRMTRSTYSESVPSARYRRRHRKDAEVPPPRMVVRRRNVIFVEGKK